MLKRLFSSTDEATLIENAKSNQKDFAQIYDKYAEIVFHFVRWRVANDALAEDIVSETFMTVATKIADYNAEKSSFKTRVLSIANYKFLDTMRKVYKEEDVQLDETTTPSYEKDFAQIATNKQLYGRIITFVQSMSDRQSSIFFLRFVEEVSNKEIAQIYDIDERTVSSTLSHVLTKIKKHMAHREIDT